MQNIPLPISTAGGVNTLANREEIINLFAEVQSPNAKKTVTLLGTSGAEEYLTLPSKILGQGLFKGELFVVTSTKLYVIRYDNYYEIGDVDFDEDKEVYFASNGVHLVLTSGKSFYYKEGEGVQEITHEFYRPSTFVTYQDGYFIFTRAESGEFFISKLYSVEFIGTDYATAESLPDKLLRVVSLNRQLWLIGERSIEVWYNSGDVDFPFSRINGAVSKIGCLDANTIQIVNNSIIFVGNDENIYQTIGYTPTVISNLKLAQEINQNTTPSSSTTYHEEGHNFYIINFRNRSYGYDALTSLWHTRESNNKPWIVRNTLNYKTEIFGISDSKLLKVGIKYPTELNKKIERVMIFPPINKGVDPISISAFTLDMQVGESKINNEIFANLSISKNGGVDYGFEHKKSVGKVGEFLKRVKWRQLGRGVNFVFKVSIIADIQIKIIGGFIETR